MVLVSIGLETLVFEPDAQTTRPFLFFIIEVYAVALNIQMSLIRFVNFFYNSSLLYYQQ